MNGSAERQLGAPSAKQEYGTQADSVTFFNTQYNWIVPLPRTRRLPSSPLTAESPLTRIVREFPRRRVLVVGDLILDHYIHGIVTRVSPEAPVPVLLVDHEEYLPGGAANVARNLADLGARVEIFGLCGNDDNGRILLDLLKRADRIRPVLLKDPQRPTIVKTRCMTQGQQMLRLDREVATELSDALAERLLAGLAKSMPKVDGVILSDYGKGLLTNGTIASVMSLAADHGKPVFVDPKGYDYRRYRGATVLTPNLREAQEASGVRISDDASLAEAARVLHRHVRGESIVITLGPRGVAVFPRRGKPFQEPAVAREVYDVTGAGDTFISVSALSRLCGASHREAVQLGNAAAGIVVGRVGVATVEPQELLDAIAPPTSASKLATADALLPIIERHRRAGRRVVFTNGFFDLLHAGHIRLLEAAHGMGDVLVVALNSDESIQRLKGAPRPILNIAERLELLGSLPFVDHLLVFDEDTPEKILRLLRPDVLVKGGPSPSDTSHVVGREIVEAFGGEIRVVPVENGVSISALVHRATEAQRR